MAERRTIVRDLVAKLSAQVEPKAEKAISGFKTLLKGIGKGLKIVAADFIAYNIALKVANAQLGSRALQANLARVDTLIRTVASGAALATDAYHRFASGIGLVNQYLAEQAHEIARNAESLRMTTRDYQSVTYAFERFGLTEQDVRLALVQFGEASSQALDKINGPLSQAREEFKQLGITIEELSGRNPLEVMELVADKYKNAPDQQKALRAVYHLLGEEMGGGFTQTLAKQLTPALAQGAGGITALRRQALNEGLIIDDRLIQQGEQLAKSFSTLNRLIETFWQSVGLRLAPAVEILVDLWHDLIVANRQWIEQRIEQAAQMLTRVLERLDGVIRNIDLEALLALFGAKGIFEIGVGTVVSLMANMYLLIESLIILRVVAGLAVSPFKWLWARLVALNPALAASIVAWYEWAAAAAVATASATAFQVATGAIFAVVGLMAALAAVMLFLTPIALGLWLVIEDILTFTKGGKSALGETIEFFRKLMPYLDELPELFGAGGEVMVAVLRLTLTLMREFAQAVIQDLVPSIQRVLISLAELLGFESIAEMLRNWRDGLSSVADVINELSDSLDNLDQRLTSVARAFNIITSAGIGAGVGFGLGTIGGGGPVGSAEFAVRGAMAAASPIMGAPITQNITINGADPSRIGTTVGQEAYRGARDALEGSTR